MFFRQCKVSKPLAGGTDIHVAWIPERYARAGKTISFKIAVSDEGRTDIWDGPWTVDEVWGRVSEEYVREHERDYKTQREASDI